MAVCEGDAPGLPVAAPGLFDSPIIIKEKKYTNHTIYALREHSALYRYHKHCLIKKTIQAYISRGNYVYLCGQARACAPPSFYCRFGGYWCRSEVFHFLK